jgi:hypothetical protein
MIEYKNMHFVMISRNKIEILHMYIQRKNISRKWDDREYFILLHILLIFISLKFFTILENTFGSPLPLL